MGTRNITEVILGGETVIKQYGQWDGYPSYMGDKVLQFIKRHDMEVFAEKVRNYVSPFGEFSDEEKAEIERIYDVVSEIYYSNEYYGLKYYSDSPYCYMLAKALVRNKVLTESEACKYIATNRDIGCHILDAIMENEWEFKVVLDDYEFPAGEAIIDLDTKEVTIAYYGKSETYSFDTLKHSLDIDKAMKRLERSADENSD